MSTDADADLLAELLDGPEDGRKYHPRGFYWALHLPFERRLVTSASVGLRPRDAIRLEVHRAYGKRLGFRVESRRCSFSISVDDLPRVKRRMEESYSRREKMVNAALPADKQVVFARGEDGGIRGWGDTPVQADGVMGAEKVPFHFRFRYNTARLTTYPVGMHGEDGQHGDEVETATIYGFYPGDDWAGAFENDEDMARAFATLAEALAPVDEERNPTYAQEMGQAILRHQLATIMNDPAGRDLRKEEALLTGGDTATHHALHERWWLEQPEVKQWIEAGRPDAMAVLPANKLASSREAEEPQATDTDPNTKEN